MPDKGPFHETYVRAAGAVAYVAVIDRQGNEGIGTAFHIGDGIFVTARHVVDGVTVKEIATTKSSQLSEEAGGRVGRPRRFTIVDGPHSGPDGLDVAIFRVDLGDTPLPAIAVSSHTDYSLEEYDLILSDVAIIGYPPIPFTTIPNQVVALGQINAVVRVHHSPITHFIVSATARGGFSGGVALDSSGLAVGLVTESLGTNGAPVETGYMSLLSIEPAVDLAAKVFGFSIVAGYPGRHSDTLFAAKFSQMSSHTLSSFIYDAGLYVYDDNRDVFIEIVCDDGVLRDQAAAIFHAITPIHAERLDGGAALFTPLDNPPPRILLQAGEAVAAFFHEKGYRMIASERGAWQLQTGWGA